MKPIAFQTLFFAGYLLFLIVVRLWARDHSMRRAEEERKRRVAQEREWRVGIPYDPEA